ncbi:MAG: tRNA (guanosine(37)-N1)-methyltransferase TrmD, partial [Deltaproteobacteria bacterium]|nr:tRNA (guanosine(37)-N1)-methyltransferase TrmD [Deltaproteobacteria bacterium]
MIFHVITIFPEMFNLPVTYGVLRRGHEKGLIEVRAYDLRDYTEDRHRSVDDKPYGGGAGMVMLIEPVVKAIEDIKSKNGIGRTILLSASGKLLRYEKVKELAALESLLIICGRYEGIDERVLRFVDEEISIGEYVLSGGEFPAP